MVKNRTFRALRHRNFRLFFFGQLTSLIGSWMQSVAQGWLVLQLSNSAFALGLVGTFGYLPTMLFSFWGGSVADRKSKRRIVLATQTVAMCLAFSLAFLVTLNLIKTWHVVLLAFFMGTVMAFDLPARQSFLIELVGREDLTNAIGLNSSIFNAARLIGPGIAGFVIAYLGLEICFLINGLSFLAVIVSLLRMQNLQQANMVGFKKKGSIKEMAYYIRGQKEILMLLLLVATFSILVLPYTVLLPIFARDILKVGPKGLGFLFSAMGLGALIGAIMIATIAGQRDKLLYLWSNALLFGALIWAFSLCNQYYLALFLLFLAGMTMVGFLTTANAYVQLNVPDDRRGRIMGLYSIVFLGMMPVGSLLSGSLSQYIGVQRAISTGAILAELITFGLGFYLFLTMGSRRRSDHKY